MSKSIMTLIGTLLILFIIFCGYNIYTSVSKLNTAIENRKNIKKEIEAVCYNGIGTIEYSGITRYWVEGSSLILVTPQGKLLLNNNICTLVETVVK